MVVIYTDSGLQSLQLDNMRFCKIFNETCFKPQAFKTNVRLYRHFSKELIYTIFILIKPF